MKMANGTSDYDNYVCLTTSPVIHPTGWVYDDFVIHIGLEDMVLENQ